MFRVFSGKFCGAIEPKPEGFVWTITLSDLSLPDDQMPIAKGIVPTMNEALKDAYASMTALIAATDGHETEPS
jgi:hypothetical protein